MSLNICELQYQNICMASLYVGHCGLYTTKKPHQFSIIVFIKIKSVFSSICFYSQTRCMHQLMDLFALPEMTLYSHVIEVSISHLIHSQFCCICSSNHGLDSLLRPSEQLSVKYLSRFPVYTCMKFFSQNVIEFG